VVAYMMCALPSSFNVFKRDAVTTTGCTKAEK
jgi:hypothetical protein